MKKTSKKVVGVTSSGGDVFADMGIPGAKGRLLKTKLVMKILQLIEQKGVSHAEAGQLINLDQSETSNLMRGRIAGLCAVRSLTRGYTLSPLRGWLT